MNNASSNYSDKKKSITTKDANESSSSTESNTDFFFD